MKPIACMEFSTVGPTARPFLAGDDYSIADMAAYPWIMPHEAQGQNLQDFPNVDRWFNSIGARTGLFEPTPPARICNANATALRMKNAGFYSDSQRQVRVQVENVGEFHSSS